MSERLSFEPHGGEMNNDLETLDQMHKIEELLGWIIECGPGVDPMLLGIKRGKLQILLSELGFYGGEALAEYFDLKNDFMKRQQTPCPTIEIPNTDWFSERIDIISSIPPTQGVFRLFASIQDVAEYAYTDWEEVYSRDPRMPLAEYTRRLTKVMCDPVSYRLNIPKSREGTIEVSPEMAIQNGRHRSLALRSLGIKLVVESGMQDWVEVESVTS